MLPCEISDFLCKYLGLPLSIRKLTKEQLQPIIDRIADQLSVWKAELMTRAGRVVQVQHVLTAMLVYLVMSTDLPIWAIKAIDKIRRGSIWRGRKESNGGHCLIAWPKVCRSRELGGLGISDLKSLSLALRLRWPWLRNSEPNKPWANSPLQTTKEMDCLLSMAVVTKIVDGANTFFWKDRWVSRKNVQEIAPRVYALVLKRVAEKRTVLEALINDKWVEDIQGSISLEALLGYLTLWDMISEVELQVGVQDKHIWRLSKSGQYTAKSAYDALFQGAIFFRPLARIWKSWAPPKCHFFMWLVVHNRCWTADRLERRGLPHPDKCPLCDQEEETIQHLLVRCVVARRFWYSLFYQVGLSRLASAAAEFSFDDWWESVEARVSGEERKGINS
jgi:hypothetical protein